jgi:hypothetical protein
MSDPTTDGDWAARTADSIERVVLSVRDRTTRPILLVGRAAVFGLLAGLVGVAAIVLLSILIQRILTDLTGKAWIADMILGGLFSVVGIVLLVMRNRVAVIST